MSAADPAANLAANMRQLREARGLTQGQLARIAGIPRPTWGNLETGAANPTLSILIKVAGALQVSIEELIGPPRTACRFYPAAEIPQKVRGSVVVRKLLPDPIPGLEIDRMELAAGAQMRGIPHTPGTREYLTCERGAIEIAVGEEQWQLAPGDVLVFRGDQNHAYFNRTRVPAIAYSIVAIAPAATPG